MLGHMRFNNPSRERGTNQEKTMTRHEAIQWVRSHGDMDDPTDGDLDVVFRALYGREPDETDREEGLWSHCCAAVETD